MITLSSGGLAVAVLLVVLTLAIRRGVGPIGVVVAAVAAVEADRDAEARERQAELVRDIFPGAELGEEGASPFSSASV